MTETSCGQSTRTQMIDCICVAQICFCTLKIFYASLVVTEEKTRPHTSCPHSEIQQFREEVRNSPEVKFAVQAFAAVNSNNFVRFFKLVKGASYLASCLLHRYFNQVRNRFLYEWVRLRKPGIFP